MNNKNKFDVKSSKKIMIIYIVWEQSLMDYNLQTNFIFFHFVMIKKNLTKKRKIYTHSHFLLHFIMGFDLRYRGTKIQIFSLFFDHEAAAMRQHPTAVLTKFIGHEKGDIKHLPCAISFTISITICQIFVKCIYK